MPHDWEIGSTAKVLCDSYGVIQVNNNMPPSGWNKYRFTWSLQNFNLPKGKIWIIFAFNSAALDFMF